MVKREFKVGLKRGIFRRCPNCGESKLFDGYLKVRPTCAHCAHPNGLYRADDAAPYFTILLVGHLVIAPMLTLGILRTWPLIWLLVVMLTLVGAITLTLLPIVKGAVIGVLWSLNEAGQVEERGAELLP